MSREEQNKISYIVSLIAEFAERLKIDESSAFCYLEKYKGLEYIMKFYDVLHTLSYENAVEDLQTVCAGNGGDINNAAL